jgi:glycosyltransferase involved in cell wall biosynthesis
MGCGNFVLAHDNPFNREVLGPMAHYFGDESDLPAALQHAEHTRERQRRMVGDGARDRAMNFYSWDHVVAAYMELLQYELHLGPQPIPPVDQELAG